MTLTQFMDQRPNDVTHLIQSIQTLQEETPSWHAHESHETTIHSFFHTFPLRCMMAFISCEFASLRKCYIVFNSKAT